MTQLSFNKIYLVYIILMNVTPLLGVLFFSWSVFYLLFFYWIETVAIATAFSVRRIRKIITNRQHKKSATQKLLANFSLTTFVSFILYIQFYLLYIFSGNAILDIQYIVIILLFSTISYIFFYRHSIGSLLTKKILILFFVMILGSILTFIAQGIFSKSAIMFAVLLTVINTTLALKDSKPSIGSLGR